MSNPRVPHAPPDGKALRSFLDRSPVVVFIKDEAGRYLYVNPGMERLFGISDADVHGRTETGWMPPQLAEVARAQDRQVLESGTPLEQLDVVTRTDGSLQQWRVVKFVFEGSRGERLIGGMAVQVTDLQATQEKLAESERRYRHLVESAQGLICTHDMDGHLLTVNQAALSLTGLSSEQVIGQNMRELLGPPSRDAFTLYLERMAHVGSDEGMMHVRAADGRMLAWKYRNVRVDEPGKAPYVLGHAQDVTELRDAEDQLRRLAMTDDLTGLLNRRGFLVNGSRSLHDAVAHNRNAALFYVDIDGLKNINDRYGHDAGSSLIVAAADTLKNSFRAADVLARIGGDEFVALVIVPPDDIATITNRLRWHVDKFNGHSSLPYALSMSYGVSHYQHGSAETLESLLKAADVAMYRRKRPGNDTRRPDAPD